MTRGTGGTGVHSPASRALIVGAAAALVVAGVAAALLHPGRASEAGRAGRASTSARAAPSSPPTTRGPAPKATGTGTSLVPAGGAYLGAYVHPKTFSQQSIIDAVNTFQQMVGRPIDLVHVYHPWLSPFPSPADKYFVHTGKVLLLTWGGTADTREIIAGKYDALIRKRAEAVKTLGRPILLEYRHEMDRPNLQWAIHGPANYIAAWDHIRRIFTEVDADNVNWVWCPTAWGFQKGYAQAFYPGNNEVDWLCADAYSTSPAEPLRAAAGAFLSWASHYDKPVIIGEFASGGAPSQWAGWLAGAVRLAQVDRQIKAFAYFDGNGYDSQGRPFGYWMADSTSALQEFGRLLAEPFFHPAIFGH